MLPLDIMHLNQWIGPKHRKILILIWSLSEAQFSSAFNFSKKSFLLIPIFDVDDNKGTKDAKTNSESIYLFVVQFLFKKTTK